MLDSAAQNGIATSQIAATSLSIDDAYEVQRRLVSSGANREDLRSKVGFTSKAKMIQMGGIVIFGHLTSDMQIQNSGRGCYGASHPSKVEPEIAFRLAEDVDYVLSPESALSTVDAITPAWKSL